MSRMNSDDGAMPLGAREAARFGAISTFENADGERLVIHRLGSMRAAAKAACEVALRLDETFRIVCVSTPQTIYTDMQGARGSRGRPSISAPPAIPERLLGRDLRAMIHPRVLATVGA